MFSSKNVTFDTKILKTLVNDAGLEGEILDDLLQELFVLFPDLNQGLNPLDSSKTISTTRELIKMYLEGQVE